MKFKLYDKSWVVGGLIVFAGFFFMPFWLNPVVGGKAPDPKIPVGLGPCVHTVDASLSAEEASAERALWMRKHHMQLLDDWRNEVVRIGDRKDVPGPKVKGKFRQKSLTETCMECHDRQEFCLECHSKVNVELFCWDCHIIPGEDR